MQSGNENLRQDESPPPVGAWRGVLWVAIVLGLIALYGQMAFHALP